MAESASAFLIQEGNQGMVFAQGQLKHGSVLRWRRAQTLGIHLGKKNTENTSDCEERSGSQSRSNFVADVGTPRPQKLSSYHAKGDSFV